MAPKEGAFGVGLDRRFVAIVGLTLLLGSISIIFTVGYFFFGWGGQYKYELFYFPSPVIYTLDSLTTTGRMLSFILPAVAFLTLLLTAGSIRISSPRMLSAEHYHKNGDLPGSPMLKQYPTGILAVSAGRDLVLAAGSHAPQASFVCNLLSRLFPYDRNQGEAGLRHIDTNLAVRREKTTQPTAAREMSLRLLTKT